MYAMTMTDAHFWVNGATEDEPVRCRAGSRRLGALRVGRIGALMVVGVAHAPFGHADRAYHSHAPGLAVRTPMDIQGRHTLPEGLDRFGLGRVWSRVG